MNFPFLPTEHSLSPSRVEQHSLSTISPLSFWEWTSRSYSLSSEHSIALSPSRIEQKNSTLWAPYLLWLSEQKFPYFLTEHSLALFPSRIEQQNSTLLASYIFPLSFWEWIPVLTHWALYSFLSISYWAAKFYSRAPYLLSLSENKFSVLSIVLNTLALFLSRIEQHISTFWFWTPISPSVSECICLTFSVRTTSPVALL